MTGKLAHTAAAAALVAAPAGAQAELELRAPALRADGLAIPLRGAGAAPSEQVRLEARLQGRWRRITFTRADANGRFARSVRPRRARHRYAFRATTAGAVSRRVTVRARPVLLAAVGDVNLGDGPGAMIDAFGPRYPWTATARSLRGADVAFGNLECAVSTRGAPVPKQYNFRGRPAALKAMSTFAGFDVLNLANNHTGDYGTQALLDTVRNVRRFGMRAVGAGGSLGSAAEPRVITRLGLRIAFVGFSNLLPAAFYAGPNTAGTQPATPGLIAAGVRRARRRADVVVATFHWGVERATTENARQRAFAHTALQAGADAVIGAHPHVLQPIRRAGPRRLVAYSLGNFVFGASSGATARTGILRLELSASGVEGHRLAPAVIEATRPRLLARQASGTGSGAQAIAGASGSRSSAASMSASENSGSSRLPAR
jgi:poly-gamma-glutamate capsule biosynthesis protein CapA/YwtB (metallophosphatase superfamily)